MSAQLSPLYTTSLVTPTLSSISPGTSAISPLLSSASASGTTIAIPTPLDFGSSYCYVQSDRNFPHIADARNINIQLLDACLPNENDMQSSDPTRHWSSTVDDVWYWYSVSWLTGCVLATGATVENVGFPLDSEHPQCVEIFQQNIHECTYSLQHNLPVSGANRRRRHQQ